MTENKRIPEGFQVDYANYAQDFDALRRIREVVFVQEQRVPREIELDEADPQCAHVIARDLSGVPIGTGRLMPDGRIGRMAVLGEWRSRGVGGVLLQRLIELARMRGLSRVHLHAQIDAQRFYAAHGFDVCGEGFREANIAHVPMQLALLPMIHPTATHSETLHAFRDEGSIQEAVLECLQLARHSVDLLRHRLDAPLAKATVVDTLRRLAISGVRARIRILLHEPDAALRDAHPLVPLLQRLPSAFAIREIDDAADREDRAEMTLNDRQGLVWRANRALTEAQASTHAPGRRAQLAETFEQKWERALPCVRLRALSGL
ncbi:MAG: putative N-acetyltransferase YjcF [Alphaproteobacteria bacterium ADurb.BinA280]|nr:GNAT family N-acetyltransferase [Aquimonas sp.]OPZ11306.1 MAG: putative N-acetyltransferase YjcF [Alphaproteobacteria bacterium ADurb.BinA280]